MNAEDLILNLTYINYAHNRTISPDVTPERWGRIYGVQAVEEMEERYQRDLSAHVEPELHSCKMCGDLFDPADLSNRTCSDCMHGGDSADYKHEQRIDRELLA